MKKSFMMAAIVLFAATSCTNESVNEVVNNNAEQTTVPVRVRVSDFSISMEEFPATRSAVDPSTYNGVGAMTLAFYNAEGTEVYKTTQVRNDGTYTTFGEFTANLQVGTYTMVALGYYHTDGDVFVLTSPTLAAFTSEKPRETFCKVQSVTVTAASPLDLSITLNRIVAALDIVSTDNRPVGIANVRVTYAKGSKSFNPTTGLAANDAGFSQVNAPTGAVGSTVRATSYPFLTSADDEEEEIDITIEVLDADDHVLFTHTVEDVPFRRNRRTTLRGALFTAPASAAGFQLETSWLTGNTVDF